MCLFLPPPPPKHKKKNHLQEPRQVFGAPPHRRHVLPHQCAHELCSHPLPLAAGHQVAKLEGSKA